MGYELPFLSRTVRCASCVPRRGGEVRIIGSLPEGAGRRSLTEGVRSMRVCGYELPQSKHGAFTIRTPSVPRGATPPSKREARERVEDKCLCHINII